MPTIRLTPSTYYFSNSTYLSVSNVTNAYNNTDNTSYATVTNSASNTTSYYIYLIGFNFNDIPQDAVINSFAIKIKVSESNGKTSGPEICRSTTALTGSAGNMSTSEQVLTFSGVTTSFDTIKSYGTNFGIRINCGRNKKNTKSTVYIYGAEIEVNYSIPGEGTPMYINLGGVIYEAETVWINNNGVIEEIDPADINQSKNYHYGGV